MTRFNFTTTRRIMLPLLFLFATALTGFLTGCKDDPDKPELSDADLYELAKQTANFTWYNNSDSLTHGTSGSEHGMPYFRTRFNEAAATMLDASGKVKAGANFPEGSLIVKELFDSTETFGVYSLRYLAPQYSNADAGGFVWGVYAADGTVMVPSSNRGAMCLSCHSRPGNNDLVLLQ